jgi:hypothetical protein
MKTILVKSWKVEVNGKERRIRLYDENDKKIPDKFDAIRAMVLLTIPMEIKNLNRFFMEKIVLNFIGIKIASLHKQ